MTDPVKAKIIELVHEITTVKKRRRAEASGGRINRYFEWVAEHRPITLADVLRAIGKSPKRIYRKVVIEPLLGAFLEWKDGSREGGDLTKNVLWAVQKKCTSGSGMTFFQICLTTSHEARRLLST